MKNNLYLGARVLLKKKIVEERFDDIGRFLDSNGDVEDQARMDDYVRLFMTHYLNPDEVKCFIVGKVTDEHYKLLLTASGWYFLGTFHKNEIRRVV
jgi:hypothetical protein